MDELEAGKQAFVDLVRQLDTEVQVVIPTAPSNGQFLIALAKGANRKFVTVPEDDLLDLPGVQDVQTQILQMLKEALSQL
ncbi:MAG: hypothetical protein D6704_04110 [Nitrospirae bacterium]|nr:MAG: hypothetical protein D6704_04110 [Nitrospirota bacterium]